MEARVKLRYDVMRLSPRYRTGSRVSAGQSRAPLTRVPRGPGGPRTITSVAGRRGRGWA